MKVEELINRLRNIDPNEEVEVTTSVKPKGLKMLFRILEKITEIILILTGAITIFTYLLKELFY